MEIAILLFSGITALDAIGPYEALSRIPEVQIKFVGINRGSVKTSDGMCTLVAEYSLSEVTKPDVLIIPGGWGTDKLVKDSTVLDWISKIHETTQWTASVCTGSLVLGAAGILTGLQATTHWSAMQDLLQYGALPVQERVVRSGKLVTAAGVSAGIDMAFQLILWMRGENLAKAIQLSMEYDPKPPFDGAILKTDEAIKSLWNQLLRCRQSSESTQSLGVPITQTRSDEKSM